MQETIHNKAEQLRSKMSKGNTTYRTCWSLRFLRAQLSRSKINELPRQARRETLCWARTSLLRSVFVPSVFSLSLCVLCSVQTLLNRFSNVQIRNKSVIVLSHLLLTVLFVLNSSEFIVVKCENPNLTFSWTKILISLHPLRSYKD